MASSAQPTVFTVYKLRALINPLLNDLRQNYGAAFADPLATQATAVLHCIQSFALKNDQTNKKLMEEQLYLAKEELCIMNKEQEEFCDRCDRDIDYAVTQWQKERTDLLHSIKLLQSKKEILLTILSETSSVLQLYRPINSDIHLTSENEYIKQATETIFRLERRWAEKCADLEEAHEELDNGVKDLRTLADIVQKMKR